MKATTTCPPGISMRKISFSAGIGDLRKHMTVIKRTARQALLFTGSASALPLTAATPLFRAILQKESEGSIPTFRPRAFANRPEPHPTSISGGCGFFAAQSPCRFFLCGTAQPQTHRRVRQTTCRSHPHISQKHLRAL